MESAALSRIAAGATSAGVVLIAAWLVDPALASSLWGLLILVLALGALAAAIFRRGPTRKPLASTAVTVLAPILVGMPLAHALFLRHMLSTFKDRGYITRYT